MIVTQPKEHGERGQSLVELSLFVPILLFMIIGMAELGVFASVYIDVLDASRASARYVSPLDPAITRCQPFANARTGRNISFTTDCMVNGREYHDAAVAIKGWGAASIYDTCQDTPTINFFYVAGCMALRNTPTGFLNPANNFDDIVVTTVPITTNGQIVSGHVTWSFFGNQPTTAESTVVDITDYSTLASVIKTEFSALVGQAASAPAPSTGLVVVEVYHAQPQLTKLYWAVSRLAGSAATIPDPIPIHTYTIFPLPAAEPK